MSREEIARRPGRLPTEVELETQYQYYRPIVSQPAAARLLFASHTHRTWGDLFLGRAFLVGFPGGRRGDNAFNVLAVWQAWVYFD